MIQKLLELIYPTRAQCIGCGSMLGQDEPWFCASCLEARQGLRLTNGVQPVHRHILSSCHAYRYHAPMDAPVRYLKYSGVTMLAKPMAADMALCLNPVCRGADVIVPVPMPIFRKLRRGFNHAELLARELSHLTNIPMENALTRKRNSRQQARLSKEQRLSNLTNAFAARGDVSGKSVLLVDDVYTTGATAENCAIALLDAGAKNVCMVTYALSGKG